MRRIIIYILSKNVCEDKQREDKFNNIDDDKSSIVLKRNHNESLIKTWLGDKLEGEVEEEN